MIIYVPCRAILTRQEINHKSCYASENWLSWRCLTSVIKRGLVFPSWHHLLTSFLYTMDMTFDSYSVQASSHASMVGLTDATPPIQLSPSKQITVPSSQALSERKESQWLLLPCSIPFDLPWMHISLAHRNNHIKIALFFGLEGFWGQICLLNEQLYSGFIALQHNSPEFSYPTVR